MAFLNKYQIFTNDKITITVAVEKKREVKRCFFLIYNSNNKNRVVLIQSLACFHVFQGDTKLLITSDIYKITQPL